VLRDVVRHLPVGRRAGMKTVARHHAAIQREVDRHARHIAAADSPLRERPVMAPRIGTGHPAQRLRQARKLVHRRQRRKGHVAHAAGIAQPVGERLARCDGAVCRDLVDDIVDAGDDDSEIGLDLAGMFAQQGVRLRRRQPRASEQAPAHGAPGHRRQCLGDGPSQRFALMPDADTGG
jgi:hypothetical protein